jgi:hypothetical protein
MFKRKKMKSGKKGGGRRMRRRRWSRNRIMRRMNQDGRRL